MAKYRKKPIIVLAEQFNINVPVEHWPEGVMRPTIHCVKPFVQTLEGDMSVNDKDWIITGIQGEKYPCNPAIFEQTYEKVEETEYNDR